MADRSKRSWCSTYWTPIVGCSKVSTGCFTCWAAHETQKRAKVSDIYKGLIVESSVGPQWTGVVRLVEERLNDPLKWKGAQTAWVTSMSDLFHEKLAEDDIAKIYSRMVMAPQHIYKVLTKRIERADELLADKKFVALVEHHAGKRVGRWPLENCWLGTSVENQATCSRLDALAKAPATKKFVSFQPLLEPVNPMKWLKKLDLVWAVLGGEAGPRCRTYKMSWGLELQNQLSMAGIPNQLICYPYGE